MHIAMVSATFDADVVNGVLRMVQLYRKYLEARGHQVTVFALGAKATIDDVTGVVRSPGIALGDYGYYAGLSYTREAQRLLATADIVHCHHLFMSLELAHRYANVPIVYTNHTRYDLYAGNYAHLPQPIADALLRYVWPHFANMADAIIAPSEGVKQVMHQFDVLRPITVIENGIELEPFQSPVNPLRKADLGIPEESTLAIYCGRLSAEKDIRRLVRLFATAARQRDDLHLLLVGRGSLEDEVRRMSNAYGLSDRMHLTGAVDYDHVARYLAAGDLFITASQSEVHPLTVIEAMAGGLPVVAFRSVGMETTIESGKTGILVESAGSDFVDAILTLAQDVSRRHQMGAAAQIASGRFDINHTVDRTLALYDDLLARQPHRQRIGIHGKWRDRTGAEDSRVSATAQNLQPVPLREIPN